MFNSEKYLNFPEDYKENNMKPEWKIKRKRRTHKKTNTYIPGLRGQRRHTNNRGDRMIQSGWAHERLKKVCEQLGLKCI